MPRVIFVSAQPPSPEGGAAGRCALATIRGLAAHGVPVRAFAPRLPGSPPGEPPDGLDLQVIEVADSRPGLLRRLIQPAGELVDSPLAAAVAAAASGGDLLHLDQIETVALGWPRRLPTVVHLHYRALLDQPLGWPTDRRGRRLLELAWAERRAARRHEHLLANSDRVAASLRRIHRTAQIGVLRLPLDVQSYPRAPLDGPPVAGLIGTASWGPTAGALSRLRQRIWPAVRSRVPEARLLIAGRGTRPEPPGADGVHLLGEVPSAAQFLTGLSVLVYPPVRGSGTKVKVLEALCCGVPVVTNRYGAEGLGANAGLIVVSSDADLVAASARLLSDPAERTERGAAAASYARSQHAPLPATAPLVEFYRRMLG